VTSPIKFNGYHLAEFVEALKPSLLFEKFTNQTNPFFAKIEAERLLETKTVCGYVEKKYEGEDSLDAMLEWLVQFKGTDAVLEYDEYYGFALRWWPKRAATDEELDAARVVLANYKEPESNTIKFRPMIPFTVGYGDTNNDK
jgi:hypothetical protein